MLHCKEKTMTPKLQDLHQGSLLRAHLNLRKVFEGAARLHDQFVDDPVLEIFLQHKSTTVLGNVEVAVPYIMKLILTRCLWKGVCACISSMYLCSSRMAGKFSGFLSKKYSGGSPGTNSSQRVRMPCATKALSKVVHTVKWHFISLGQIFRLLANESKGEGIINH